MQTSGSHAERRIDAEALTLSLVARKLRPRTRWAVLSDGHISNPCRPAPAGGGYLIRTASMLAPMNRGDLTRCIERARSHHHHEPRRTWGVGIRAIRAEVTSSFILQVGA